MAAKRRHLRRRSKNVKTHGRKAQFPKSSRTGRRHCTVNMKKLLSLEGFSRLGYIANCVELKIEEIAQVVESDPTAVKLVLETGTIHDGITDTRDISDRLYLLDRLFACLLRLDQYSGKGLQELFSDKTEFQQCTKQPPWYPKSLRQYLLDGGLPALRDAVAWLNIY